MVSELNYMSQVVVMLYEDPTKDPSSEERFHVELHFSPGVNCCVQKNLPPGPGFRPHSRNESGGSKNTVRYFKINCISISDNKKLYRARILLQQQLQKKPKLSIPPELTKKQNFQQNKKNQPKPRLWNRTNLSN